jgi:linoleoyl-CoA desaturase
MNYKFSRDRDTAFSRTLMSRVNTYFRENQLNRQADRNMVIKSIAAFGFYLLVYFTLLFSGISNLIVLWFLFSLLGLGQALIGMALMHDAVHGAYTKNRFLYYLLQVPIVLIGVESLIWKIEHNLIHHNYTNVEEVDQDIHPRYVFRFSQHQPLRWFHKYQHLYATFIYGLMIIEWVTVKDFLKVLRYRRSGIISTNKEAIYTSLSILFKKTIFYLVFLVLPLKMIPLSAASITVMFVCMLVVSGVLLTIIFQLAHVVPGVGFVKPENDSIEESWHMHQMKTTSNFATNSRLITHLVGGLNYQIEHHLFPDICHVHYPKISEIVRQTALEFNAPYFSQKTLWGAVNGHYRHLREMGQGVVLEVKSES